jgi:hypothetical protein
MRYLSLLIILFVAEVTFGQTKLPIIKATSKKVSVRDGAFYDKDSWNLSPKARPDVYTADRTRETKYVIFYTDIDSIRVKVKPGTRFNFVILYNGKDSCYTQIASAIPPDEGKNEVVKNDTIPFTITKYNAIAIKVIINDTDTINMHFDCSAFNLYFTRDAVAKDTNLKKVRTMQLGTITWHKPETHTSAITAHEMDGRIGYNVFDGKCVEINNDKGLLLIHSRLPSDLQSYKKYKIDFIRSFPCLRGEMQIDNKTYTADYLMDNGAAQVMLIDSTWAAEQNFPKNFKIIKTNILRDPRGTKFETHTVLIPKMTFNGIAFNNVPVLLLGKQNPVGLPLNYLDNGFLKHYNIVFDFRKDYVYLKPDKLMDEPFQLN